MLLIRFNHTQVKDYTYWHHREYHCIQSLQTVPARARIILWLPSTFYVLPQKSMVSSRLRSVHYKIRTGVSTTPWPVVKDMGVAWWSVVFPDDQILFLFTLICSSSFSYKNNLSSLNYPPVIFCLISLILFLFPARGYWCKCLLYSSNMYFWTSWLAIFSNHWVMYVDR